MGSPSPIVPSDTYLGSTGSEGRRVVLNLARTQGLRATQWDLATWLASVSTSIESGSVTPVGSRSLP